MRAAVGLRRTDKWAAIFPQIRYNISGEVNNLTGRLSISFHYSYLYLFMRVSLDLNQLCRYHFETCSQKLMSVCEKSGFPQLEEYHLKMCGYWSITFPNCTPGLGCSSCISENVQAIQLFGIVRSYIPSVQRA